MFIHDVQGRRSITASSRRKALWTNRGRRVSRASRANLRGALGAGSGICSEHMSEQLGEAFSEVRCSSGNLAKQGRAPDEWCERAWGRHDGAVWTKSTASLDKSDWERAGVGLCGQTRSDLIWDYSSVEGPREWIGGSPCGAANVGAMQITARAGWSRRGARRAVDCAPIPPLSCTLAIVFTTVPHCSQTKHVDTDSPLQRAEPATNPQARSRTL